MKADPLHQYRQLLRRSAHSAQWPKPWAPAPQRAILAARGMGAPKRTVTLISHPFDDGTPIAVHQQPAAATPEYDLGTGALVEYEVAVSDPERLAQPPASAPLSWSPTAAVGSPPPPAQQRPVTPGRPAPTAAQTPPQPTASCPPPAPVPEVPQAEGGDGQASAPARTASSGDFTARQLQGLIRDDDLLADIQSILGGAAPTGPAPPPAPATPPPAAAVPQPALPAPAPPAPAEGSNEHEIFDRIAQNMRYATAYDLGALELQQRFDQFDRQAQEEGPA